MAPTCPRILIKAKVQFGAISRFRHAPSGRPLYPNERTWRDVRLESVMRSKTDLDESNIAAYSRK